MSDFMSVFMFELIHVLIACLHVVAVILFGYFLFLRLMEDSDNES